MTRTRWKILGWTVGGATVGLLGSLLLSQYTGST